MAMRLKAMGIECYSHDLPSWEALAEIDDWGNHKTRLLLWHIYIVGLRLCGAEIKDYKPLEPHYVLPVAKPKRKRIKQDSAAMMAWAKSRYG